MLDLLLRKLYSPQERLSLLIAMQRKANVKRCDRINLLISFLTCLQNIISENSLHLIAFFSIVFHRHADLGSCLGIQRGIRESHADRKRRIFTRVKYESPLPNFYLQGGAIVQKTSRWLFGKDGCLSSSQKLAGF